MSAVPNFVTADDLKLAYERFAEGEGTAVGAALSLAGFDLEPAKRCVSEASANALIAMIEAGSDTDPPNAMVVGVSMGLVIGAVAARESDRRASAAGEAESA